MLIGTHRSFVYADVDLKLVQNLCEENSIKGLSQKYLVDPVCLRVWYIGCALAFQARERGSNPLTRSMKISYIILLCFLLFSCDRDGKLSTEAELQKILGEPVMCTELPYIEGYICESANKIYICPIEQRYSCYFTALVKLIPPPAEAPSK